MMKDKQNLNKNTGKDMQSKTSKKCRQSTDTDQKNEFMKIYRTY